jgi:rhamnosyltransferase
LLDHFRAIRNAGFDIVFVTTGPEFHAADLAEALRICSLVVRRKNAGLDFGSWALGLKLVQKKVAKINRLLLVNDSIYGPFRPIDEIIAEFEKAGAEACGLNDSLERTYHLQSFFLYFKANVIKSSVFQDFWATMRCDPDKDKLIDLCEIGLSQRLLKNRYTLYAAYPCQKVWAAAWRLGAKFQYADRLHKEPLNTTLFCWDILLQEFSYPYLKTELLRTNRFNSVGIKDWPQLIPQAEPALIAAIEAHAQRMRTELQTV